MDVPEITHISIYINDLLQQNPFIVAIFAINLFFIYSVVFSQQVSNFGIRACAIILIGAFFYVVGNNTVTIFENDDLVFSELFLGLSVEMFGAIAFIIIVDIYLCGKYHATQAFVTLVACLMFIMGSLILMTITPEHSLFGVSPQFDTEFVRALGIEVFANTIPLLIIMFALSNFHIVYQFYTIDENDNYMVLLYGIGIAFMCLVLFAVIMLLPREINDDTFANAFFSALFGMLITSIVLYEWMGTKPNHFPIAMVLIAILTNVLVVSNILGEALSFNLGIEFYGALIATALKDRGMLVSAEQARLSEAG